MGIRELEKRRQKDLWKFWASILSVVVFFTLYLLCDLSELLRGIVSWVSAIYVIAIALYAPSVVKAFENTVKTQCINDIVEKIVGNRGRIFWCEQSCGTTNLIDILKIPGELKKIEKEAANDYVNDYKMTKEKIEVKAPFDGIHDVAFELDQEIRLTSIGRNLGDFYNIEETKLFAPVEISTFGIKSTLRINATIDDSFYGIYENVDLGINETEIILGTGRGSKTIFKGMVLVLKAKAPFNAHTIIGKGRAMNTETLRELVLSKSEFSRKFNVYTSDFQKASEILNSRVRNLLLKHKNARMACFEDKVVLTIPSRRNLFKLGSLFKNVNNEGQYAKFVQDFKSALKIVEELMAIDELHLI